jgi:NitT/TauT family transport system substrate-binding protein
MENLGKLMSFVSGFIRENGFPDERVRELELATEEALVNIIDYAYAGQEPGEVEIRCHTGDGDPLTIEFMDSGVPFDIEAMADPDLSLPLADRKVGGLGVFLIRKMVDEVRYRREKGRNILTFLIHKRKRKVMKPGKILLYILLFLLSTLQPSAAGSQLKKAAFIPQWVPQAQFAGYYVALNQGIYRKHGIDLTILTGGPSNPPLDLLRQGKADFASLWLSTAVQARSQGIRLVNIAQILQRSGLMLVAKKSSGIYKPGDMNGKKVGLWPASQTQPRAFFKKYNLEVREVPQTFSVDLFLRDGVDVASAMWYNEYHTILDAGMNPDELIPFFFQDYGLNFPEDGIYALSRTVEKDPDLCRAFVTASLEGWKHAFNHPDETLDMVLKNLKAAHVPATRVQQKWILERMKDLMSLDRESMPAGMLGLDDYNRVARILHESELIEKIPEYRDFYKAIQP